MIPAPFARARSHALTRTLIGRSSVEIIFAAGLVVLVGVLATLQYRWLGRVSDAERSRLQASLQQRAEEFGRDLDREISRVYATFQDAAGPLGSGDLAEFARRYNQWRTSGSAAALVKGVYRTTADGHVLQYHPADAAFSPVEWPEELRAIQPRHSTGSQGVGFSRSLTEPRVLLALPMEPFVASIPALVVSIPSVQTTESRGANTVFSMRLDAESLIVWLDRRQVRDVMLPALADRHFARGHDGDYRLAIVDVADASRVVFSRGVPDGSSIDPNRADATVSLGSIRPDTTPLPFDLRGDAAAKSAQALVRIDSVTSSIQRTAPSVQGRMNVFVEQHTASTSGKTVATFRTLSRSGWTLVVQHASGSLETLVAQGRRRNLFLSFGILALLGASVGLITVNAQRSRRLAAQHMDFVAAVSHELRTPLAVIQSAAQNLSAGVVDNPAQTRQYGALIDAEGRRLTDMVEQILQFAGLASSRAIPRTLVDAAALARQVASSYEPLARGAGLTVELDAPDECLVEADEEGLRRAITNLVGNGIKYAAGGGWIGLSVRHNTGLGTSEIQIQVADRGPGIAAEDLPHVFEPFYRSRTAIDRQIRGNGLGLALVKRIMEAHGGRVTVDTTPGQGAVFTLHVAAAGRDLAGQAARSSVAASNPNGTTA